MQTGMENQAFLTKWIKSHADACKKIGKPFVLEEFGKNVTAETDAAAPKDWKKVRGPMFARAYSEYINSLENGGNYQGEAIHSLELQCTQKVLSGGSCLAVLCGRKSALSTLEA